MLGIYHEFSSVSFSDGSFKDGGVAWIVSNQTVMRDTRLGFGLTGKEGRGGRGRRRERSEGCEQHNQADSVQETTLNT